MSEAGHGVLLGDCIRSIRSGVSLSGEPRQPTEGEVGVLTLSAVSGDRFEPDACKAVPEARIPDLGDSVRGGTLLMSRSNTIDLVGSTVLVHRDYPRRFLPDLLWEIVLREDSPLTAEFLDGFFRSQAGRRLLRSAAMGTSGSMKKLSMRRLRALTVPAIPMQAQVSWAGLSCRVSRLIALAERLIAAKREQKRTLLHDLLTGGKRFPEFGASVRPSGAPPLGWTRITLGDLGRIVSGGTPATGESAYWNGGVAWCTPTDITALETPYITRTERELSEAGVSASSAEVLPIGSVIVCTRATIGDAAINTVPMATNQGFKAIVPKTGIVPAFVYYLILHKRKEILRRGAGSTFHEVSARSFSAIPATVPESEVEQRKIADTLRSADREIHQLQRLKVHFTEQKRGVMERILSGDLLIPPAPEDGHA